MEGEDMEGEDMEGEEESKGQRGIHGGQSIMGKRRTSVRALGLRPFCWASLPGCWQRERLCA